MPATTLPSVTARIETRAVGLSEVDLLERLFATERTARRCWCMSFCTSRWEFAAGWFGGGNKRRFEAMASRDSPMGVLASSSAAPVGWGACGPRSRYLGISPSQHPMLGGRDRAEDESVWLLPCLFIHADHRAQGVGHALIQAATSLARERGAVAVEAWPLSASEALTSDAFVGREQLFAELGFRCVGQPISKRVIMRLDFVEA